MDETNITSSEKTHNELDMFRMSAQHLIQLVEYYRCEADPRLALAVQRAIKAHIAVTEALDDLEQPVLVTEEPPGSVLAQPTGPAVPDTWVESPWAYLDIPARSKGRLGPMPRFVPLSPNDTKDESDDS